MLVFQGRLAGARLPQLVLRRETIARLSSKDAGVVLEMTNMTNMTNRGADTIVKPGDTIKPARPTNMPLKPR